MIFFHYKNFLLLYYIKIMKKITMKLKTCTSYSLPNKKHQIIFFNFLFLIIHDFIFNICYLFCNIIYLYYFIIYIHITIININIIKMKNSIFGESKFFFAKVIAFISFPKNRRRNWNSIPAYNLIFFIYIYIVSLSWRRK